MGKARKTSRHASSKKSAAPCLSPAPAKSRLCLLAVAVAIVGSALVFASLLFLPAKPVIILKQAQRQPTALSQLLAMARQQLAQVDIGTMNLICAAGLPGAEHLDIPRALATLDQWAARVKQETDRQLYRFRRDPAGYNNSEGYFRMLMLVFEDLAGEGLGRGGSGQPLPAVAVSGRGTGVLPGIAWALPAGQRTGGKRRIRLDPAIALSYTHHK